MLKTTLMVVVGVCVLFGQAFSDLCWENVVPQNVTGFDFEITSVVQGPDKSGIYVYTYTIYRLDQGTVRYKGVSHISFWFPCGPAAQRGVINGILGITATCTGGGCPVIEMGETNGMSEPVLDKDCRFFWGFKLDDCGDDQMLVPTDINGVSYPLDPNDPYCTITFRSRSAPAWGKWLVKGGNGTAGCGRGCAGSGSEKSGLYDSGDIKVPTCIPAVDVGNMNWGGIKVMYR